MHAKGQCLVLTSTFPIYISAMPTPAVTLKLKKFRRHFGIAAPRVTIRSHIGWPWYLAGVLILIAAVSALVWSLAQQKEATMLEREIRDLRHRLLDSEVELRNLRADAATKENAEQMERSAQQQLLLRIKLLEKDNAALREDVSLFERLVKECPRKPMPGKRN